MVFTKKMLVVFIIQLLNHRYRV